MVASMTNNLAVSFKARRVGYILRVNGKSIYIAGDTGTTKEARQVKRDIALLPIGETFTMDAKRADLANTIRFDK